MKCERCSAEFEIQRGLRRFCSLKCRNGHSDLEKEKIRNTLKSYYLQNPEAVEECRQRKIGKCTLTEEGFKKLRYHAVNNNLGGLNSKKKFLYNGVYLQSSYEFKLAKLLDELKIEWNRPKPFNYFLEKQKK